MPLCFPLNIYFFNTYKSVKFLSAFSAWACKMLYQDIMACQTYYYDFALGTDRSELCADTHVILTRNTRHL